MIEYTWHSKLLRTWRGIYMTTKRAVMQVKTLICFGDFCCLNSSCIRKSIPLMLMSSSRGKVTLLWQNSVTDVSVAFRPTCWCPSGWAPVWRLHTKISINLLKHFCGYLVYEILLWPESWRGSLHIYLLSLPRFWTLSLESIHWKPEIATSNVTPCSFLQ